jgi:hypothetical protein
MDAKESKAVERQETVSQAGWLAGPGGPCCGGPGRKGPRPAPDLTTARLRRFGRRRLAPWLMHAGLDTHDLTVRADLLACSKARTRRKEEPAGPGMKESPRPTAGGGSPTRWPGTVRCGCCSCPGTRTGDEEGANSSSQGRDFYVFGRIRSASDGISWASDSSSSAGPLAGPHLRIRPKGAAAGLQASCRVSRTPSLHQIWQRPAGALAFVPAPAKTT